MIQSRNNISLFGGIDRVAIILYLLLVMVGLVCVASAGYNDDIDSFFSIRQNHVKQALWACVALVVGIFILLLDSRYYHMYAYYIYFIALIFTDDYFAALDAADDAAFLTLQLRVHFKVLLAGVSLPVTAQSHIVAGIVYYIVIFIDNHDVVKAVDEQTSYTKHFIFLLYYVAAYLHLPQLLHG